MTPAECEIEQQRLIAEYLANPMLWPAESRRRFKIRQANRRRGKNHNGGYRIGGHGISMSYAELQVRIKADAA